VNLRAIRRSLFVLMAVFAVGSGCVCQGQRMRWPPDAMSADETPAGVDRGRDREGRVLWVLEWNGETGTPVQGAHTALVCRFHRLTEKGRPKLADMRFAEPLMLSSDDLIATDETVVVQSDIELDDFKRELDRHGKFGLWFLQVAPSDNGVVYWSHMLSCEVRRQGE
jgi:hypothetical protein